ncbi:hypothetical protein HK104_000985 [Borealophlyctis nickersoniae]|nr:hypothetical protein HK104_000985 [Borealophlyctis nickersoniae]
MNDAAAIISTCSRLLSRPRTLTETEALAAAAACDARLEQNQYIQLQHEVQVSRPVRPRLPSEVLDAIIREIPYDKGWASLLACSSVNKEWRRKAWTRRWKEFVADITRTPLATIARRFLLPWALETMKGLQVRVLVVPRNDEPLDDLSLLLAPPTFRGLRRLGLAGDCSTFHLLMAFRSLPNLIFFQCNELHDGPVAWGEHLRLGEKEQNEIWRMGLGNLKALVIHSMKFERGGIMLQKLTTGLGPKLESLHLRLENAEAEYHGQDFAELLRNLPKNFHNNAIAKKDVIKFLRERGKDLIHLEFPNDNDCSFAKLNEFLPNIRYLGTSLSRSSIRDQDVIAFLEGAKKLENLWMSDWNAGDSLISEEIWDVASARDVELLPACFPSYTESKEENWVGL